jgi:hypothetical protein
MLTALKRGYLYSVTTLALIYLTLALEHGVHEIFLHAGLEDVTTVAGLLDALSDLPTFTNYWAIAVIFLLGAVHWWFVRRDRNSSYDGRVNAIRAGFLAGFAALCGLRIIYDLVLMAHSLNSFTSSNPAPVAAPLATVAAWMVALVLTLYEWARGGEKFDQQGQRAAMLCSLLGQWVLVIAAIWAIGQLGQSILQSWLNPLPACSADLDILSQLTTLIARAFNRCTDTPAPLGATVTVAIIGLGIALYALWGRRYTREDLPNGEAPHETLRNLDAFLGAALSGITLLVYGALGVRLLLDVIFGQPGAVFPGSLLSTPDAFDTISYPFVGPLVAGACMLIVYGLRQWRRNNSPPFEKTGLWWAEISLAIPFGAVLLWGACMLLGHAMTYILHNAGVVEAVVTSQEWSTALMLFIPGLAGVWPLWDELRSVGRGGATVSLPGYIYVFFFLAASGLAILVSVVIITLIVARVLGPAFDPTNYWFPHLIAVIPIAGSSAAYFNVLRSKWPRR